MDKVTSLLNKVLAFFCTSLSILLVVCVVFQVFSRYVLGTPSTLTDELARFLFIWVGLMGAAYAMGQKRHLAIDLLVIKLEEQPVKLRALKLLISVISMAFAGVIMVYGGGSLMMKTLATGQVSPSIGVEMGLVYAAIPLSGCFMLFYLLEEFLKQLSSKQL